MSAWNNNLIFYSFFGSNVLHSKLEMQSKGLISYPIPIKCGSSIITYLISAWRVTLLSNAFSIDNMSMASNISEYSIHTQQPCARTDAFHILVRNCMEVRHTFTFSNDFIVCCRKEAIGKPISESYIKLK